MKNWAGRIAEATSPGSAIGCGADETQEPGRERGGILEVCDLAEGQRKGFLGDVGGFVEIAAQPDGVGHREIFESIDDRRPCSGVAPLRGCSECRPLLSVFGKRHH